MVELSEPRVGLIYVMGCGLTIIRIDGMYIKELLIKNFRGFSHLNLRPNGHVAVMGEPRAGRSDLIEALGRALDADSLRTRVTSESDFHNRDTSLPIEIVVTIAAIEPDLEQHFIDFMEFWDSEDGGLLRESMAIDQLDDDRYEMVLHVAYHARWSPIEERCEEWIHFPKFSDPDSDFFHRASRRMISELGYATLRWGSPKVLELRPRANFRRVIERSNGEDFAPAIEQYVQDVGQAAEHFTDSNQLVRAIDEVMAPINELIGIPRLDAGNSVRFEPEGGSTSGLLRSLGPTIDAGDGTGHLPAWRRGSTTLALLRLAEVLALSGSTQGIFAIDDLGDSLDLGAASHLATTVRKMAGQAWVTTRVASVAEAFEPQEVVRLGQDENGVRIARQGKQPSSKVELTTAKHWHRNLLHALSFKAVVVVEGPNDFVALHSLARRMADELGYPPLSTYGACLINAGITGSGGYPNVLRLAGVAKEMGLRSIGIVDGDVRSEPIEFLASNIDLADVVIRMPEKMAIEAVLLEGLADADVSQSVRDAASAAGLTLPTDFNQLTGHRLKDVTINFLKRNSLHGMYVDSLPIDSLPAVGLKALQQVVASITGNDNGLMQL